MRYCLTVFGLSKEISSPFTFLHIHECSRKDLRFSFIHRNNLKMRKMLTPSVLSSKSLTIANYSNSKTTRRLLPCSCIIPWTHRQTGSFCLLCPRHFFYSIEEGIVYYWKLIPYFVFGCNSSQSQTYADELCWYFPGDRSKWSNSVDCHQPLNFLSPDNIFFHFPFIQSACTVNYNWLFAACEYIFFVAPSTILPSIVRADAIIRNLEVVCSMCGIHVSFSSDSMPTYLRFRTCRSFTPTHWILISICLRWGNKSTSHLVGWNSIYKIAVSTLRRASDAFCAVSSA